MAFDSCPDNAEAMHPENAKAAFAHYGYALPMGRLGIWQQGESV